MSKDEKEVSKENQTQDSSLTNRLIVPVLIALVAGGTSPWWASLIQGKGNSSNDNKQIVVSQPANQDKDSKTNSNKTVITEQTPIQDKEAKVDSSINLVGTANKVNDNSVNVSGSGNVNVSDSGNSVAITKESDSKYKGEYKIPNLVGMTYHKARQKLLDEGWIPITQHSLYVKDPNIQSGNGQEFWKLGYWEIISCSGTGKGYCRFKFADPSGRGLVIITAGMEDKIRSLEAIVSGVFLDKDSQ